MKCVDVFIEFSDNSPTHFSLLEDYNPIYTPIKSIVVPELKENVVHISVSRIKNPLNDDKNSNLNNLIRSNKELLSLLRDLLKKRSIESA